MFVSCSAQGGPSFERRIPIFSPNLTLMTEKEVRTAVDEAIRLLETEEPRLDFEAVHERSTAHRLAVHLEPQFKGWNVDCEYDRDGTLRKALEGIAGCSRRKSTDDIFPDIIVHHRLGEGGENNLLAIELNKRDAQDACDHQKLMLLTDTLGHYQYQMGLYINIDHGFSLTWYKDRHTLG